jgi:hypothetical protein
MAELTNANLKVSKLEFWILIKEGNEPKSDNEILKFVNESFNVNWNTLAQVNFRLLWLINLGKIKKEDKRINFDII